MKNGGIEARKRNRVRVIEEEEKEGKTERWKEEIEREWIRKEGRMIEEKEIMFRPMWAGRRKEEKNGKMRWKKIEKKEKRRKNDGKEKKNRKVRL